MSDFITNAELRIEAERLVDENEKLGELVRDMWRHMVHSAWHEEPPCPADFADRMRELGVDL